jgi:hypothetical protein
MAACATAATAQASVAADEAAQPKPGAASSPQRAPMRSRSTGLMPRLRRMAESALERNRCYIHARWDRVRGGTLGGGAEGSVQPLSGALRARVTSWESSGALE